MSLLRQIFKPVYRFLKDPSYRAYLRVQKTCKANRESNTTIWLDGYVAEGKDGNSLLHLYEEIIERKSFDFKCSHASPVIYCCGANIGLEVLHLEQMYPGAEIKAFEPDPVLFSVLQSNIERNDSRAKAVRAAVYTANGTMKFSPDGKLGGKLGEGNTEVETVRLRDFLEAEKHIDLLIMDIEGCELEVLRDCQWQLTKTDHLFVEWHSAASGQQTLPELLQILTDAGFRYRLHNNAGSAPFIRSTVENGFDAMVEIYATRQALK